MINFQFGDYFGSLTTLFQISGYVSSRFLSQRGKLYSYLEGVHRNANSLRVIFVVATTANLLPVCKVASLVQIIELRYSRLSCGRDPGWASFVLDIYQIISNLSKSDFG